MYKKAKKKTGCSMQLEFSVQSSENMKKKKERKKSKINGGQNGQKAVESVAHPVHALLSLDSGVRNPFRVFTLCVCVGPRENRLTFESCFQSSLNSAVFWKYLHVPFIKIWRKGAVAARVVNCGCCWWYGTAALVFLRKGTRWWAAWRTRSRSWLPGRVGTLEKMPREPESKTNRNQCAYKCTFICASSFRISNCVATDCV